jgi:hypothetical protein
VPEQKILSTRLVLATRPVELSRNEDLSGVMQHDTHANQRSVDREVEGAGQLKQAFARLADELDVPQETRWRTQSLEQKLGVVDGCWGKRHVLACSTYRRSASKARRSKSRSAALGRQSSELWTAMGGVGSLIAKSKAGEREVTRGLG